MTLRLFVLMVLLIPGGALRAQEVTVPELPKDHILDQTGKVTTEERKVATEMLKPIAEHDGVGVYLVLLNSSAEEPPADVARRLAQSWRVTADTAVVLTAPDLNPPIIIEVAGVALGGLKDGEIKGMKDAALAAVAKGATGVPAMLAAAKAMGEEVHKFRAGTPLARETDAAEGKDGQAGHLSAWIAGGAGLCCLVALVLMRRGRHHALIFPPTEPRRRFSAPHSGGNDAMVAFAKREN